MSKKSAKLSDVARMADVSTATVSRALTLPHKVKPETLRRINEAVRRLRYVPHGAARALASRRTHTVGAVVPSLDNAIFANTTHALQKTLDEAGYTLLLACHEFDPQAEVRMTRTLIERGVDGLVLFGTDHDQEMFRLIKRFRIPYVLTWALDRLGTHPSVGFDSREAGRKLTQYLIALGHHRFAVISGLTANNERARERLAGVKEALAAARLTLPAARLVEVPFTYSSAREGFRRVIAGKPYPTAVVCGNDLLAIGAIAEAHAMSFSVPHDLSISGFDDMEIASLLTPGLTTVHFPAAELGQFAARHIVAKLAGESVTGCQELPVELVIRGSTAAPRLKAVAT